MPRARRVEPFLLVLKDEDKGIFTVVGPMTDDTPWIDRISKAQERKRQVTCYTADRGLACAEVIANAERFLKLRYVDEVFV
jgi:hypothetical protein